MINVAVRIITMALMATAVAQSGLAQQTPPVLSTAPDPPPGAVAAPAQMSGLPLQVGDLPPGIVAVRVIRRTFSENVQGITVVLEDPVSGEVLEATTNAEGRAQFTAMPVGSTVQARATVDGESLASQLFPLPAQGGVRLVLVAGVGAATPGPSPPLPAEARSGATPPSVTGARGAHGFGVFPVASVVLACAALVMGFAIIRRRRGHEDTPGGGAQAWDERDAVSSPAIEAVHASQPASDRRTATFEELVRLEKDHRAGRIPEHDYAWRREVLLAELVELG